MAALLEESKASVKIQAMIRGFLGKAKVRKMLEAETRELVLGSHATCVGHSPSKH